MLFAPTLSSNPLSDMISLAPDHAMGSGVLDCTLAEEGAELVEESEEEAAEAALQRVVGGLQGDDCRQMAGLELQAITQDVALQGVPHERLSVFFERDHGCYRHVLGACGLENEFHVESIAELRDKWAHLKQLREVCEAYLKGKQNILLPVSEQVFEECAQGLHVLSSLEMVDLMNRQASKIFAPSCVGEVVCVLGSAFFLATSHLLATLLCLLLVPIMGYGIAYSSSLFPPDNKSEKRELNESFYEYFFKSRFLHGSEVSLSELEHLRYQHWMQCLLNSVHDNIVKVEEVLAFHETADYLSFITSHPQMFYDYLNGPVRSHWQEERERLQVILENLDRERLSVEARMEQMVGEGQLSRESKQSIQAGFESLLRRYATQRAQTDAGIQALDERIAKLDQLMVRLQEKLDARQKAQNIVTEIEEQIQYLRERGIAINELEAQIIAARKRVKEEDRVLASLLEAHGDHVLRLNADEELRAFLSQDQPL